jgi:hypothetical protein
MNYKRFHFILIGILGLSIIAFLLLGYELNVILVNKAGTLTSLKAKTNGLEQEQTGLIQDKKDIAKYSNLYKIAQDIVPENKDQAEAVRQIVNLASANNVFLASISFPTSNLGTIVSTGVAPKVTPNAPSPSTNSSSLSQLTPVPNIPGIYELPITIQSSNQTNQAVTYPELIGFLSALENNRLTALINSISITPQQNNPNYFSFNLIVDIYVKPGA